MGTSNRPISLDVLRGITILLMILVSTALIVGPMFIRFLGMPSGMAAFQRI